MALEDIAMFRAVQNATVFYPSDGVSMERAVELAANTKGICFIRSSRPATQVVHTNEEEFRVGLAKVGARIGSVAHLCHLGISKIVERFLKRLNY